MISRKFHNGWKINFGPGVERKLDKDKTLALFRLQSGYDWHSGSWSWGPHLTVDLIEDDNTTYYAGLFHHLVGRRRCWCQEDNGQLLTQDILVTERSKGGEGREKAPRTTVAGSIPVSRSTS